MAPQVSQSTGEVAERAGRHQGSNSMNTAVPRLRMFAGPNGSGKSAIKDLLPKQLLGVYVNPDEIEKAIRDVGFLDLGR